MKAIASFGVVLTLYIVGLATSAPLQQAQTANGVAVQVAEAEVSGLIPNMSIGQVSYTFDELLMSQVNQVATHTTIEKTITSDDIPTADDTVAGVIIKMTEARRLENGNVMKIKKYIFDVNENMFRFVSGQSWESGSDAELGFHQAVNGDVGKRIRWEIEQNNQFAITAYYGTREGNN